MEELWEYHDNLIKNVSLKHFRYLFHTVDWNMRMLGIKGPRGTGKTTMMLQHIKLHQSSEPYKSMYITLEHPYFYSHSLFQFTTSFYNNGGRHLYIDEVHKYTHWSRELKVIYDGFPDLTIAFSASSALDIFRGEADLSRRATIYELQGLSFREYLDINSIESFGIVSASQIFSQIRSIPSDISSKIAVLPHFKNYLKSGYYPFHVELQPNEYLERLVQVVNTIIDSDLTYINGYSAEANKKIKKLLRIIAESVPFKPNISELSRKSGLSRDMIYLYLEHLESARLVNSMLQTGKGVSSLTKPDKLYLDNSNLSYAIYHNPNRGNLRETFMLNQLTNIGLHVSLPKKGDFYLDDLDITLEVGGKNKSKTQVADVNQSWIVEDDIVTSTGNNIPLWLFGFFY